MSQDTITVEDLPRLLENDISVKVAGIDCDGILRGKVMAKEKFLGIAQKGFGFSSAVFGWDMQDVLYTTDAKIAPPESGYVDFIAVPDLSSYRRIPWEDNIPFFLVRFVQNEKPVTADGRSMLRSLTNKLAEAKCQAMAGVELEFMNFQTPSQDGYANDSQARDVAAFLERNAPSALRPMTAGSFSYSATRPVAFKKYFWDIFNTSAQFNCGIEGWHTEGGPGVYEAALKVCNVTDMADRVSLFKLLTKSIGIEHGITPCFMAKPMYGQPGSSGHIHISLCDLEGKNLFARDTPDPNAPWSDAASLSDMGRQFLAGLLEALPDIMPLFAPTINSYKRLVENYWAPVNISWGLEDRMASIRIITPPVCKPGATRMEVRIPGADLHPHYALSVILAAGWRGIEKKLDIKVPPMSALKQGARPELLPNTLEEAIKRFSAPESIAREILDGEFVDFFTATREHELKVWREAVTDCKPTLERNVKQLLQDVKDLGISFRPHVKTLKSLEVTRMMLGNGTHRKIVASTLCEIRGALPLAEEGILDECLYGLPIYPSALPQLAALSSKLRIVLMVDNEAQIDALEAFAQSTGRTSPWSVFIKVDVGSHRAGLESSSPALQRLVEKVEGSSAAEVYGFYCHAGHSYACRTEEAAAAVLRSEVEGVVRAAEYLHRKEERKVVVSFGSTPTAHVLNSLRKALPEGMEVELHAGNFPANDLQQVCTGLVAEEQQAVRVLAEVCSVYPERNEALINAGTVALTKETSEVVGFGRVTDRPGWAVVRMAQEHGILGLTDASAGQRVEEVFHVGQKVMLHIQHACITAAQHHVYYVVDEEDVVRETWVPWKGW
ncbi:hypothetical protein CNMCM7691_008071 [Aspergillus felis]|uniref:D-serine dehydratase n=1 Tax=Aspergillus felis TaxID=1287682 RepID=A0A8H6V615_9EURO|nr:hypothetical protein CNMCM7691_008071 [Aspergillus felis]